MNEWDRFNDLQKQGFMKPRKVRKVTQPKPVITCDDCLNWHTEGKHTASKEERAANRQERKRKEALKQCAQCGEFDAKCKMDKRSGNDELRCPACFNTLRSEQKLPHNRS